MSIRTQLVKLASYKFAAPNDGFTYRPAAEIANQPTPSSNNVFSGTVAPRTVRSAGSNPALLGQPDWQQYSKNYAQNRPGPYQFPNATAIPPLGDGAAPQQQQARVNALNMAAPALQAFNTATRKNSWNPSYADVRDPTRPSGGNTSAWAEPGKAKAVMYGGRVDSNPPAPPVAAPAPFTPYRG